MTDEQFKQETDDAVEAMDVAIQAAYYDTDLSKDEFLGMVASRISRVWDRLEKELPCQ